MVQPDPHHQKKLFVVFLIVAAGVVLLLLQAPIPQDLGYHAFADERTLWAIPNFHNVLSNLPFVLIGLFSMYAMLSRKPPGLLKGTSTGYYIFFAGIIFTGLGSAYYHLNPTNETLLWDRLPMTIAFMGFFAMVVSEYVHFKAGKMLLWPLLLMGILSVMYWFFTEQQGKGDLRFYALVQFMPILLTPVFLLLFRSPFSTNAYTWYVILAYALAKVFETYDAHTLEFTQNLISGHSIKHVLAAAAPLLLLVGLYKRRIQAPPAEIPPVVLKPAMDAAE